MCLKIILLTRPKSLLYICHKTSGYGKWSNNGPWLCLSQIFCHPPKTSVWWQIYKRNFMPINIIFLFFMDDFDAHNAITGWVLVWTAFFIILNLFFVVDVVLEKLDCKNAKTLQINDDDFHIIYSSWIHQKLLVISVYLSTNIIFAFSQKWHLYITLWRI